MNPRYDEHPNLYYNGDVFRYSESFRGVNWAENGRQADEFINFLKWEGVNCYIPSGKRCFLQCIEYMFRKDFTFKYSGFIRSFKRRTNVLTRWRIQEFCERNEKDTGIYDLKSKRILFRFVKRRDVCLYIQKNHYCVIWKKIEKNLESMD